MISNPSLISPTRMTWQKVKQFFITMRVEDYFHCVLVLSVVFCTLFQPTFAQGTDIGGELQAAIKPFLTAFYAIVALISIAIAVYYGIQVLSGQQTFGDVAKKALIGISLMMGAGILAKPIAEKVASYSGN